MQTSIAFFFAKKSLRARLRLFSIAIKCSHTWSAVATRPPARCLYRLGSKFRGRSTQAVEVPYQLQLRGLGLDVVRLGLVGAVPVRHGGACALNYGGHAVARAGQHLVHAGEDLFGGAGEGQLQGGHVVAAEPAGAGAEVGVGGGGDGLAHARRDERAKHVARAAEVAVDGGEDDLEEAGLAARVHAGADDAEVVGRVVGRGEAHGCDDDVRDVVLVVQGLDGAREAIHVGDFDLGQESGAWASAYDIIILVLTGQRGFVLGLKLVRQDEVRVRQQGLVRGDDVLGDVDLAVVAHDGVEDPEEAAGRVAILDLELLGDVADGDDGLGAGDVAREHHVEVVEVRLPQPVIQVGDFLGRDLCACPLPISRVVAWWWWWWQLSAVCLFGCASHGGGGRAAAAATAGTMPEPRRRERNSLNCTVLRAATSHPSDWRTKTAILLPTYLQRGDAVNSWRSRSHAPWRARMDIGTRGRGYHHSP